MTRIRRTVLVAVASMFSILATSTVSQAGVLGTSFIDATDFVIKRGDRFSEDVLDANSDFTFFNFTSTADAGVALGTDSDDESAVGPPIDIPVLCVGACPQIGENAFPVISGAPVANYSTTDQLEDGVPIDNANGLSAPERVSNGAYVGIDTGSDSASSNTNTNQNASWVFELAQSDGITFEFNARAYLEAFVSSIETSPAFATANYNFIITLSDLTTGTVVFSWTPDGSFGNIVGGSENSDPFSLNSTVSLNAPLPSDISSTGGIHTIGTASSGFFSATTNPLAANVLYQLSIRIESNADATRVGGPDIEIEKFTNGRDADLPNGADDNQPPFTIGATEVPKIAPGDPIIWTYKITNTGTEDIPIGDITVTDSVAGVNPVISDQGDGDDILSPGEMWFYQANGVAQDLGLLSLGPQPDGSVIVEGCNPNNVPGLDRNTYNNVGTVTIPGVTDEDPSHYCNPPRIDIEKLTNGNQADGADDVDVPEIEPGDTITWTYIVTNTGTVSIPQGDVTVTDSVAGVNPVLVDDGNGDGVLSPGEVWTYEAMGIAQELSLLSLGPQPDGSLIVNGCNPNDIPGLDRNTYNNVGTVTIPGDMDEDPSHHCNPPEIDIEKTTDSDDNLNPTDSDFDNEDDPNGVGVPVIPVGSDITWTYKVTNTGTVNIAQGDVTVTDSVTGVNPVLVDDDNGDGILSPGEMWFYEATGTAQDLGSLSLGTQPDGSVIVDGCNPNTIPGLDRNTYNNVATVTIPGATDSDPSHYCNPPMIDIEKTTDSPDNENPIDSDFDNEDDPNGVGVPVIPVGSDITWTYKVTNTGDAPIAESDVEVTDSVQGVNPVLVDDGNGDGILSPGEMWFYEAMGTSLDLEGPVPPGVTRVLGCNPNQEPGEDRQTYVNTGTVTIPGDTDSDPSHYCNPPPEPGIDIEKVTNSPDNQNVLAPDFDNEDFRNRPGVPVIPAGSAITWTYKVTNTGNVDFDEIDVEVVDTVAAVMPIRVLPDFMGNDDNVLEPGEMWKYEAMGSALDLLDPPTPLPDGVRIVPNGCSNSEIVTGGTAGPTLTYQNDATVTWLVDPTLTDTDRSHYCNPPPAPEVEIEKTTNGPSNSNPVDPDFDNEDDPNGPGIPVLTPGDTVTWTYKVTNTGTVTIPEADVTVTDSVAGVNPVRVLPDFVGNDDNLLEPGEMWRYEATGVVRDLEAEPLGDPIVTGCNNVPVGTGPRNTYQNLGTVTVPGDEDSDPSHYCNPEPASLGDYVWNDLNADGIQNDGETGINGVTVRLLSCAGVELATTVTGAGGPNDQSADPDGFYEFTGLVPGCYKVMFDTPAGFVVSPRQQGANPALDSDGLMSDEVNLAAGERDPTLDSGFYEPASLGDYVWNDLNADGIQNDGETGINGVTVRLLSCAGVELATTVTSAAGPNDQSADPDGFYEFTGLVPGCYKVMFDTPAGFVVSPRQQGANPALDSDGLMSDEVTLASGERDPTLDSGFVQLACEILVEKTCIIPEPPVNTLPGKCSGKLQEFTVIWPDTLGPITLSQVGNLTFDKADVMPGDEVTFFNPSGDNDVFVNISGSVNGQSKFHLSCSDGDMNADDDNDVQPQVSPLGRDCGKFAGNAKGNEASFINDWIFEGLVDADGLELDCTAPPDFPTETEECAFTPPPPDTGLTCSEIKDITELTMVWDGPDGVNVTPGTGVTGVSPSTVNNGDVMTIDIPTGAPNDVFINLTGAVTGESKFHISCSDDDMNADDDNDVQPQVPGMSRDCGKFAGNGKSTSGFVNEWLYAGMAGEGGVITCPDMPGGAGTSTDVIYGIRVDNPNAEPIEVQIVDTLLGIDQTETIPANDSFQLVTDPISITPDGTGTDPFDPDVFKNTVMVTGMTATGAVCEDMDMVQVKRNPPPPEPPLLGKCSGKLQEVLVYWNGTGSIDVSAGNGVASLSTNQLNTDDLLTIFTDGSTNDVIVNISGSVSGESTFHVSCSDGDMDADTNSNDDQQQLPGETQDCGKFQGDGKGGSGFINTWLLEGMLDADGLRLTCNFDPTSVPPSDGPAPGGNVIGATSLDLGDDKKAKWELTNDGDEAVFITRVVVTWPFEHDELRHMKLAGDFIKDMFDPSSPTDVPAEQAFESDPNKRRLQAGETRKLEMEFTQGFPAHVEADYTFEVEFDNGQLLTFP